MTIAREIRLDMTRKIVLVHFKYTLVIHVFTFPFDDGLISHSFQIIHIFSRIISLRTHFKVELYTGNVESDWIISSLIISGM